MKKKYLAFDAETTGLKPRHNLLTMAFQVLDSNFQVIDRLSIKPKPSDGEYLVTPRAIEVNKICLSEHLATGEAEVICRVKLKNFLEKHTTHVDKETGSLKIYRLTAVGQNVAFDIMRGQILLPEWDDYVSYRYLDTQVIAQFMQLVGLMPEDVSTGLAGLAQHYTIEHGAAHTAEGDTDTTVEVLRRQIRVVRDACLS